MTGKDSRAVAGEGSCGDILVVQPGQAESYWQPVPANGSIDVIFAPHRVPMEHPIGFGTQTVPPPAATCVNMPMTRMKKSSSLFPARGVQSSMARATR